MVDVNYNFLMKSRELTKLSNSYGFRKPLDFINNLGYLDFYDMEEVGMLRNMLMLARLIERGYNDDIKMTEESYSRFDSLVTRAKSIDSDSFIKNELKALLNNEVCAKGDGDI